MTQLRYFCVSPGLVGIEPSRGRVMNAPVGDRREWYCDMPQKITTFKPTYTVDTRAVTFLFYVYR
jgi:hypothetical protein